MCAAFARRDTPSFNWSLVVHCLSMILWLSSMHISLFECIDLKSLVLDIHIVHVDLQHFLSVWVARYESCLLQFIRVAVHQFDMLCPLFVVIILSHSLYFSKIFSLSNEIHVLCRPLQWSTVSTFRHLFGQHIAHYWIQPNRKDINLSEITVENMKSKKPKILWFGSTLCSENKMDSSDFILFIYV